MMENILCGAAKRVITPLIDLLPNLRGLKNRAFGGILDDLHLRVLALSNGGNKAIIIAFELDKVPYPKESIEIISERTGIPEENIFIFSIHNHTAPITGFRPEEPMNDLRLKPPEVQKATSEYERQVSDAMLEAVEEAVAAMRPARMGYAYGHSYININRNQDYEYSDEDGKTQTMCCLGVNPEAPIDRTLFVLKFEDLTGQPIAFFVNYPVHNTVMHANECFAGKMGISSDIGGSVCRFLEDTFAGSTAIWSSGAAGDVNPLLSNEVNTPDPKTGKMVEWFLPGGNYSILTMLATRHFADIMKVVRKINCSIASAPIAGTVDWSFTPGRNVIKCDDGSTRIVVGEGVDPYEIRLHLLKLGEVALLGFSGEVFSSLGQRIKEISPSKNTILLNHVASLMARSGYIFDDETLARDTSNLLPGHGSSHMLPGHVLSSLEKHTLDMFEKLGD